MRIHLNGSQGSYNRCFVYGAIPKLGLTEGPVNLPSTWAPGVGISRGMAPILTRGRGVTISLMALMMIGWSEETHWTKPAIARDLTLTTGQVFKMRSNTPIFHSNWRL